MHLGAGDVESPPDVRSSRLRHRLEQPLDSTQGLAARSTLGTSRQELQPRRPPPQWPRPDAQTAPLGARPGAAFGRAGDRDRPSLIRNPRLHRTL